MNFDVEVVTQIVRTSETEVKHAVMSPYLVQADAIIVPPARIQAKLLNSGVAEGCPGVFGSQRGEQAISGIDPTGVTERKGGALEIAS